MRNKRRSGVFRSFSAKNEIRESVAGTGGQMAEGKKRLESGGERSRAAGRAGNKRVARRRPAGKRNAESATEKAQAEQSVAAGGEAPGQSVEAGEGLPEWNDVGFDTLRDAALRELVIGGGKIAEALRRQSEEGDTRSAKLLIELALQPGRKRTTKSGSTALSIAADADWHAPNGETAGRKPKRSSVTGVEGV